MTNTENRLSDAIHYAATEARIAVALTPDERFAEIMEDRFKGFTVAEMVELNRLAGVRLPVKAKRADALDAMRELVGIKH